MKKKHWDSECKHIMNIWKLYKKNEPKNRKWEFKKMADWKFTWKLKINEFSFIGSIGDQMKNRRIHNVHRIHRKCSVLKSIHMQTAVSQWHEPRHVILIYSRLVGFRLSVIQFHNTYDIFIHKYFLTDFNFTFHWITSNNSLMSRLVGTRLPQFQPFFKSFSTAETLSTHV